jgi:NAD(P)-dependent dehydrogenase (short-subunit alcohol dehydrogenase family)
MYRQQSGSIVNIASAAVFGVHPGLGAYVASKAAVLALSKVAAKEAGPHGVRVNALCPGLTDTPMLRESLGTRPLTSSIAERIALGRIGTPEELAEAAVWLCSDRSSFATGVGLVVDGGRTG